MKKNIVVCVCDTCGKEVSDKETRYVIKFGHGSWDNDIVQFANEKEVCRDCYSTLFELMKPKSEVEKEKGRIEKKPRKGNSNAAKYDPAKVEELYRKGYSNRRIQAELGMKSAGNVSYYVKKLEDAGIVRGEDVMPEFKESPIQFRTIVDGNGMVVGIK